MYMRNDCNLFRQLRKYYFGVNIDVVCVFILSNNTNILCRKLLKKNTCQILNVQFIFINLLDQDCYT